MQAAAALPATSRARADEACQAASPSRPAALLSCTCACSPCPSRYDRNTFYTQGDEGYLDYPFLEESEEGKAFLQTVQAD